MIIIEWYCYMLDLEVKIRDNRYRKSININDEMLKQYEQYMLYE